MQATTEVPKIQLYETTPLASTDPYGSPASFQLTESFCCPLVAGCGLTSSGLGIIGAGAFLIYLSATAPDPIPYQNILHGIAGGVLALVGAVLSGTGACMAATGDNGWENAINSVRRESDSDDFYSDDSYDAGY